MDFLNMRKFLGCAKRLMVYFFIAQGTWTVDLLSLISLGNQDKRRGSNGYMHCNLSKLKSSAVDHE